MTRSKEFICADTDCLLNNLRNGIEVVGASDDKGLKTNSPVIRAISDILLHGLKRGDVGYWHIVRELSHSSTRYSLARALRHITNPKERGEFWIYYTLTEGSLESYVSLLCGDKTILIQNYLDNALLRSSSASATFLTLIAALCQINILPLDSTSKAGLSLQISTPDGLTSSFFYSPPSDDSGIADTGRSQEDVWMVGTGSGEAGGESTLLIPVLPPSSETEVVRRNTPVVRLRKRVSWHETVADSKERPIWERRSWNCEEWSGCGGGGLLPPEEAGVEATERGAPEGSEDPQIFTDYGVGNEERSPKLLPDGGGMVSADESGGGEEEEKAGAAAAVAVAARSNKKWWTGGQHFALPPLLSPTISQLTSETDLLIRRELLGSVQDNKSTGNKVFRLMDLDGEAVLCALTKSELCFISLINDRLCMQRVPFERIDLIEVGPSAEEVKISGRGYVVCGRGAEFCSHLDHAIRRHLSRELDFLKLHISSKIQDQVKGLLFCYVAVMCKEKIEDEREELLMCYFNKSWFPATVSLRCKRLRVECDDGLGEGWTREWCLSECTACERLSDLLRPHSFRLRFAGSGTGGSRASRGPRGGALPLQSSKPVSGGTASDSLILAASSDLSVSLWMQGILSSLSQCGPSGEETLRRPEEKTKKEVDTEAGGVELVRLGLGTERAWLLTLPGANIRASLSLCAVASVLTASTYIVLELGCHEADEGGDDWVLYFFSEEIKDIFMESLLEIRPQLKEMVFPHCALSEDTGSCESLAASLARKHNRLQEYIDSM